MKKLLLLPILALMCCESSKPAYDVKAEEAAIRSVIEASQIAWNNGDIEGFMQSYWNSDSLTFMSKRGQNHGWKETLEAYKKTYSDRAQMGTLHFNILSVSPMAEGVFVVLGRYTVTRLENTLEGTYTLVFKKIDGKWVAVFDHTC